MTIIDDFSGGDGVAHLDDPEKRNETKQLLDKLKDQLNLSINESDILENPLTFEDSSIDIFCCFHVLEHCHNSPKSLFEEITRVLKLGGRFFIATPNSVNIRKRIWVFFGLSNLPKIEDFYGQLLFWRGHVREPTLGDLKKMLIWNGFEIELTAGRNFYGRDSRSLRFLPRSVRHFLVGMADFLLSGFPTLCTDIHIVGKLSKK